METIRAHYCPAAISLPPRRRPTILLIGLHGQVGWELTRSLEPLGNVVWAGRSSQSHPLDLTQPEQIRRVVREVQPQLIVNAAAYTAVDKAETERDLAHAVNAAAPGVLAEEADRAHAALLHYSTDYVFNGSGEVPWREDDPTGPLNHYGATKLAGEEAIRATGIPHLIFRVSWVYGLHGANFVKTMLRLGAQRKELSIVDDQIGAPTSARAIADVTAQVLAQGCRDWCGFFRQHGGAVHLACQGWTSWHDFAATIFDLARQRGLPLAVTSLKRIPTSQYPTPAQRPLNSRMNCQRLEERFGLQAPAWDIALEQSLPLPMELPQAQVKAA
jgi:dTDP-4-dehydrorhamnose reductase